jgi:hypothetical protein
MNTGMRTTLEIDDELLGAARQLAALRGVTVGEIISELAHQALAANSPRKVRNGVPLFPLKKGAGRPTLKLVNELRDEQ